MMRVGAGVFGGCLETARMMKKLFVVMSIAALGLGCASRDGAVESVGEDGGTKEDASARPARPTDAGGTKPPDDYIDPPRCPHDAGAFKSKPVNPPAAKQNVCTAAALDALKEACAEDPGGKTSASCADARNVPANKTCAECIFGQLSDAEWKVILLDLGGVPPARYNQLGCVDHVTGITGCGSKYANSTGCVEWYCNSCPAGRGPSSADACAKIVGQDQCKDYPFDGACADAYQAKKNELADTCFPKTPDAAGIKSLFRSMSALACGSD